MKRSQIIRKIAEKHNISMKQATEIVGDIFNEISSHLIKGEKASITGFGAFSLRKRAARKGRNPHTGESILLPETTSVAFSPSSGLSLKIKEANGNSRV
jgi:nucleoid DNA-binding protein